jgi:hypothetical protein
VKQFTLRHKIPAGSTYLVPSQLTSFDCLEELGGLTVERGYVTSTCG